MTRYPKPGHTGGKLIREVIQFLRSQGVALPLTSDILIAVSGGPDSVALAHLLVHYGRRVGLKKQIRVLHINHGWRGDESDADAQFVKGLAKKWNVPITVRKLRKWDKSDRSWEEVAREERKRIFEKEALKRNAKVLTAHQADDLAETLVWRFFTGAIQSHGAGIRAQVDFELRPFLRVRKETLIQYLQEEGISWCSDRTNFEGRFLRSKMRLLLMPAIESLFPRAVEHLVQFGIETKDRTPHAGEVLGVASRVIDKRLSRAHWYILQRKIKRNPMWTGEVQLSDHWKLTRVASKGPTGERWILEKS